MKNRYKILIALAAGLLFISIGIDTAIVIGITVYTVLDLLLYNPEQMPVIQYMSFIFAVNFLFVPLILYQFGINDYIPSAYQLKLEQQELYRYLIPCILALIIGLNLFKAKQKQIINLDSIKKLIDENPKIPKYLMIIGVIGYFVHNQVPSSLEYLFFLLSNLRFVALFVYILSFKKVPIWYYILSYGLLVLQAITSSMFNDFLNLLFFLGFILNTRYKPAWLVKCAAIVSIILLVNTIQSIKFLFRAQVTGNITSDINALNSSLDEAEAASSQLSIQEKLAVNLLRLNQAWVTSSSIRFHESNGYDFQYGSHLLVLLDAAVLPRFLSPNKVTSGDGTLFNTYSGHFIDKGTSIALGAPTDGFIDWGYQGWIFMLFYGLVFNLCLRFLKNKANTFPILFACFPVIFYYSVRPDCETQTTLANIFKTTVCIYLFLLFYNRWHRIKMVKTFVPKAIE